MHAMLNIALRAAREASTLILDAMNRPDRIKVFEKGPGDFYTNVDTAVEEILIEQIRKAYPAHSFLAEESGKTEGEDKDTVWVIDPIDGTRNFLHGYPHLCISIACIQKGKIQHALIFDPVRQEEFSATRGNGAQLNGTRIRVNSCPNLEQATLGLSCAGKDNYSTSLKIQTHLQGKIAGLRFSGSSALDLAYFAAVRLMTGAEPGSGLMKVISLPPIDCASANVS
jgi:myo-inositol-1(or 4)-monophosphatase